MNLLNSMDVKMFRRFTAGRVGCSGTLATVRAMTLEKNWGIFSKKTNLRAIRNMSLFKRLGFSMDPLSTKKDAPNNEKSSEEKKIELDYQNRFGLQFKNVIQKSELNLVNTRQDYESIISNTLMPVSES